MRWLILLLLSVQIHAHELTQKDKPVIYYVTQNPLGAYYGDNVASFLAKSYPQYQVNTYYLNMDVGTSDSNIQYLMDIIVSDIEKVNPKYVFVYNSGFTARLKQAIGSKYKVGDFSVMQSADDVWLEDPIKRLIDMADSFAYDSSKFYILTDGTNQSKRNAAVFERLFSANGIKKEKLEILEFKDVRHLEKELRRLNKLPKSILINAMYVLKDTELGKLSYSVDLKNLVTRINTTHIDVSPYLSPESNEAVIFQIDLGEAKRFFDSYIVEGKAKKDLVKFKVLINTERFDALGLSSFYLKDLSNVDGIVNGQR